VQPVKRGGRKERRREGVDRWGRAASEREREGERERAELAAEGGGVSELGQAWEGEKWAARGKRWAAGWTAFLPPFLFLFQSNSIYLNSKSNLDSNSYALTQIKLMQQHECTNMLNLNKFLITFII
jgi:hypothetical protein